MRVSTQPPHAFAAHFVDVRDLELCGRSATLRAIYNSVGDLQTYGWLTSLWRTYNSEDDL